MSPVKITFLPGAIIEAEICERDYQFLCELPQYLVCHDDMVRAFIYQIRIAHIEAPSSVNESVNQASSGSDKGSSPDRGQAIWTNVYLLSVGQVGIIFCGVWIKIQVS